MADQEYVYIDGESHFIRSESAWRELYGPEARLENLRCVGDTSDRLVLVIAKAKVFWTRKMNPGAGRAYYFTSSLGDDPAEYDLRVTLRDFGLEPFIVRELNMLAAQRRNLLMTENLIEKAKCLDVALAVRMVDDAYRDLFDVCHLYSSDVDFLPAIEVLKGLGKQVFVHGYESGLSQQSPFRHVPHRFWDLKDILRSDCELVPSQ